MNNRPISFPQWKSVLASAALAEEAKSAYVREIVSFLRYCKDAHAPATAELAKQYLAWRERQSHGPARVALRWFFQEGARWMRAGSMATEEKRRDESALRSTRSTNESVSSVAAAAAWAPATRPQPVRRSMEPPLASSDLGVAPWERDLIKAIREKGFMWRTEQTYREWAVRFARFIAPRLPYAAGGEEVAAFLSAMAVEGRASPSAQKQALNALVFLMQEALHRDLGKMEFKRAYPKQRLPTVLSIGECQSLFAQLNGTMGLMAQLAYGAGLRLMELLRLRVQHVDLERQRLQVYAGKGGRVNGFADATGNSAA